MTSVDGSPLDFRRYPIEAILAILPHHSCASTHQHRQVRARGQLLGGAGLARGRVPTCVGGVCAHASWGGYAECRLAVGDWLAFGHLAYMSPILTFRVLPRRRQVHVIGDDEKTVKATWDICKGW